MYYDDILDTRLINDIINRHFNDSYKYKTLIDHSEGKSCFENMIKNIKSMKLTTMIFST